MLGVFEIGSNNDPFSNAQIAKLERKFDAILDMNSMTQSNEVCAVREADHCMPKFVLCVRPTIACPLGAAYPEFMQEQAKMVNAYNRGPSGL